MTPRLLPCIALAAALLFPVTRADDFRPLFNDDLSNATFPEGIWSRDDDGVITASEDRIIWSKDDYENFVLRLEFKNGEGTNSGVFVHASNTETWVTDSLEIQIADDFAEQWASKDRSWQCGAFFGRQGAHVRAVKKPGEWNQMVIVCSGPMITVHLNGKRVNTFDLRDFTSAQTNPDGSNVPKWLRKPPAGLPRKGRIGFQGKHGGAPIYLRNIEVMPL